MDIDPKLKQQLEQLLAALLQNAQDAATWAKGEIPLLVKEKIAFGRALESVEFGASVLLLVIAIITFRIIWNRGDAFDPEDDGKDSFRLVTTIGCGLVGIIATCINMEAFLMVWFAPRLYIVTWLMGLVGHK